MRTKCIAACFILILFVISGYACAQGKFDLKSTELGRDQQIQRSSLQYVRSMPRKPEGITKTPADISENAIYLSHNIMGKTLYLIIDGSEEEPKLWVDTDFDGDLAEEKAIDGKKGNSHPPVDFGSAELKVPGDKAGTRMPVNLSAYYSRGYGYIYLSNGLVCSGEIKAGENTARIQIADANLDGRYDGFVEPDFSGTPDVICITPLGGNRKYSGVLVTQPLTKVAKIGDEYYSLDLSPDASSIEVKKADVRFGTLNVECPIMSLELSSTLGNFTLEPSEEGKWQLPVGRYRTRQIALSEKDGKGVEKLLRWDYNGGKLTAFEIAEGKTTQIPAGTPLEVSTTTGPGRDAFNIALSITGRAGESYQAGLLEDERRGPAPSFEIKDKNGNILAEGKFAYG